MTTMPAEAALRPENPGLSTPVSAPAPALLYGNDEPCSVLIGWKRRDGVLRMVSATHAVVGGVTGLRPGDRVRLLRHGGEAAIHDCLVTRATLQGLELARAEPEGFLA
jgi:hypothetical protein